MATVRFPKLKSSSLVFNIQLLKLHALCLLVKIDELLAKTIGHQIPKKVEKNHQIPKDLKPPPHPRGGMRKAP